MVRCFLISYLLLFCSFLLASIFVMSLLSFARLVPNSEHINIFFLFIFFCEMLKI